MTVLSLKGHSRGLGLSPRRCAASDGGGGPPGDTEAPSVPQNLSATAVSDEQIDLTWDASTDNVGVTGYNIYRDNVLIDTSPTNAYSDTGLASETLYEYEVSAFDAAANESARSDPDSATTTAAARLSPEFVARGTASVNSVSSTDIGFTYPTEDVREDDLFIAVVAVNGRAGSPDIADTATGWTRLAEVQNNELALAVFYQRATGSESGSPTPFDWSSASEFDDMAMCQVYQFRYVDWSAGGPFGAPSNQLGDLTSLGMPTVTTDGEDGLAVAVCGFSDNIGEPAALVAATGGTWTAPRDQESTTAADDAAMQLYVAPLAEEGTISGGALSITPSAPQSSRSIALGFALRGMVDPGNAATLSVPIAASADDAREATGTTQVFTDATTIFITSTQLGGFRFTGLAALAGRTILQANLQFTAGGTGGLTNNQTWTLRGEAADSAAQYAASNGNISGRSLTTAARSWTLPSWTEGNRTLRQRSVDVRNIVQEVTDRPGFGGVVNFVVTGTTGNSRVIAAWDHATYQEASLTVRYLP